MMLAYVLMFIMVYFVLAVGTFIISAPRIAWNYADHYKQMKPDGSDIENAKLGAFFLSAFWPLAVPATIGVILVQKSISGYSSRRNFWERPAPLRGPVTAIRERREEKRQEEVENLRMVINKYEREFDMPSTVWED